MTPTVRGGCRARRPGDRPRAVPAAHPQCRARKMQSWRPPRAGAFCRRAKITVKGAPKGASPAAMAQAPPWTVILPGKTRHLSGGRGKSEGITVAGAQTIQATAASLTEARDRLSEIVESAATSGEAFTITKHGRPMAVILSYDEYESLIETLNILSDADTMAAIAEAREEVFENVEDG